MPLEFSRCVLLPVYHGHAVDYLRKSYELSWTLFPDTVLLTIGFFIFSFLIVGIFNTRTIRKTKIIDMLAAEKENDPELKKSRWIAAVVLLFEGFTVWMLLTGVQK